MLPSVLAAFTMANCRKICRTIGFICHAPCPEHIFNILRCQG